MRGGQVASEDLLAFSYLSVNGLGRQAGRVAPGHRAYLQAIPLQMFPVQLTAQIQVPAWLFGQHALA